MFQNRLGDPMYTADYFISKLHLEEHIEGGCFKEVYRSRNIITDEKHISMYGSERSLSTAIFFLLKSGQVSKFHKLKSDEIWFYHFGCPLIIHTIDLQGNYKSTKLGLDIDRGEMPQVLISSNVIFGAEPLSENSFTLVSCMVSPGFDFRDFILFEEHELCSLYPEHSEIISRLNRNETNGGIGPTVA